MLTSSLMIKLGRRPEESSGGISDPRRLDGPEPGAKDPLRSGSRITSILGASGAGALISGTLVLSSFLLQENVKLLFFHVQSIGLFKRVAALKQKHLPEKKNLF